ncbi:MAG: serine kinase [Rhodobacteraceae bacterium]|jgi:HPr kinase/phosphorylase|nr:serine kinase [Paracoccaceae bacterium]|tara:strand:+ start:216 stop:641 length:426 start_codon:yes stop_codon:yes gene_type:complete
MGHKNKKNVHGTAVSIDGKGLLILGQSGSGKSQLALALITHGAKLISDDQVILINTESEIILSAPKSISGKIEARFVGILKMPVLIAPLYLVIDLDQKELDRLPKKKFVTYFNKKIPALNANGIKKLEYSLIPLLKNNGII